jgi:hypothetical protein
MTKNNIEELLKGIESDNAKERDQYFFSLLDISKQTPEKLYSAWDNLIKILRKKGASNKYIAIHLIVNLVRVDTKNKFEKIFKEYFDLLSHESPVVSLHIAGTAWKIIQAKPHLKTELVSILLNSDKVNSCRHPELLKSYVIDSLDHCYEILSEKEREQAVKFVSKQINSESPKTRKTAKSFLAKWTGNHSQGERT